MEYNMINDFLLFRKVDDSFIQKYKEKVPKELIDIWKEYGFGSFMDGYLKIINPEEYINILNDSYFRANVSIPILSTAFGEIITWEKNRYVGIVQYQYGKNDILINDFDLFLTLLKDKGFLRKFFRIDLFSKAIQSYGALAYDECFGYVPLLALGGKEDVETIKKVKIREHIALITELVGAI